MHLILHMTNYKCNFDAVMKAGAKLIWIKLRQMGSPLLIMLFLFISTAQLFHIHTERHYDQNAAYEDKEQIGAVNKCSICDYYYHIQGQQILLFYPIVQTTVSPEVITLLAGVQTANYEFTLQVVANKGPPYSC